MKQKLLNSLRLRVCALVAILCAAFAGQTWADTVSTLTFTAACGGSGTAKLDDSDGSSGTVNWAITSDASESTYEAERGIHYGTSSASVTYIQLSTSSFTSGTISKVEVYASGNNSPSLSVTVGGNAFGSTETGITTSNTKYTFTGSASAGTIVVRLAKTSSAKKALYVKSIAVTYSTGGGGSSTYTVTYDANGGTGTMTDEDSPYEAGATVTLLSNSFTAPEGKLFSSWAVTDANEDAVEVTEGTFTMPASNVTVAAQWVDDPDAPQYEWIETDIASLTASDIFVIVGNNGSNYAMTNNNGTSNPPAATEVTVEGNKITSSVADNIRWNISGNSTDGYTFYPNGSTTTWLYCTSANNGVRVGDNASKTFTISGGYLYHSGTSRYVGIYSSQDWRCYTSSTGNIAGQDFKFYKRSVVKTDPSLTVSPSSLSLGYGEVKSFTISNSGDATPSIAGYDDTVISVEQDGSDESKYNVTYLKEGSTTITVSVAETSTYAGDSKEVTVTATDGRSAAGIAFASASQSAVIAAGTSFKQDLTNPNSLSVTYSSTDTDVATVASDGTVTLKAAGSTTINATFNGNESYKPAEVSYTLTVTAKYVATLVFDEDEVEKNSTDAPFTNDIATDPDAIDVVYSSSDTDVATVNASTGEVTIVGGGTTTITATIDDDDYEATEFTYTLTVNKADAPLSFSSTSVSIALDETESFVAPTLSNSQSLEIAYSSSNTSVATVDTGTGAITFNAVGNTTITATSTETAKYNSGEVSYTLTVTKAAETLPFSHSFTSDSGMGDFTISASGIWTTHSTYGAVAQGETSENWLLSPIINLTDEISATLTFSHATNGVTTPLSDKATLWVKEVGGDWAKQTLTYSDNSSWTYVDQEVSLNSFCGKKIQLGFKYVSSNTTGKWEIRNLRVADDRVEAPISFAEATVYELLKNKDTYEGQALTNNESLTVSYTSSNTDVATVDPSTGVVTIKAVGETNITATYAETASYKGNTATYRLVVTSKAAAEIEYAATAVEKTVTAAAFTNALTNPHDLTIAYTSSDPTVATVNASTGEVTLVKVGSTTITATFTEDEDYDGATASYVLTVIKDDAVLSFAKSSVNAGLAEGTYTQAVTTTPADLPVTYSSSDESVGTVAADGTVTLLKKGSTTITANFAGDASYKSANASYTLNVVVDYATLPFNYNSGYNDVGTSLTTGTTGFMQSGLGGDYSTTNTKLKFDGTGDYLILKIAEVPGSLSFSIKGNSYSSGSTSTFKVQTSADGESYSDIATYTELGDEATKTFTLAVNVRYVKWIYTKKGASSGGNVGLGNIKLTGRAAVTIAEACTDGEKFYGTYSNGSPFIVPADVTVSEIGVSAGKLVVTDYAAGDIVPANTGVMISATTSGEKSFALSTSAGEAKTATNALKASGNLGINAGGMTTAAPDCVYYRLTMHNGTDFGFYWGAEEGAAFSLAANKAYLAVPKALGVKEFFTFDNTATAIHSVVTEQNNDAIFNLAGQKMNRLQKGINIVNGKKIFIK